MSSPLDRRIRAGTLVTAGRKAPKKRTYNTRLIKRNLSYTIQEIAELFDLHTNAVRQWIRAGLTTIDNRKPFLIHGEDLIAFLNSRQAGRKRKCAADELYCCRCRAPRHPHGNVVSIEIANEKQLVISAKCERCGTTLKQMGSVRKLDNYRSTFTVQTMARGHIRERTEASAMCDLDEERSHAELQPQE